MATVNDIRQDAIVLLSQVAGTGTQRYGEDRLLVSIRQAFNALFKKDWWPEYMSWQTVTLDGTAGQMTTAVEYASWQNIRGVWVAATDKPVLKFPNRMNPNAVTGTYPRYWRPQHNSAVDIADKPISFLPLAATGTVTILGRVPIGDSSSDFNGDTTIKLDRDLLAIAAALDYASDDGDNPVMIAKLQSKFTERYRQMRPAGEVVSTPRAPDIPDQWQVI